MSRQSKPLIDLRSGQLILPALQCLLIYNQYKPQRTETPNVMPIQLHYANPIKLWEVFGEVFGV